jgi:hypothetical protein
VDFSFTEEQTILRDSIRKLMDRIATPEYVTRRSPGSRRYREEVQVGAARPRTPGSQRTVCW